MLIESVAGRNMGAPSVSRASSVSGGARPVGSTPQAPGGYVTPVTTPGIWGPAMPGNAYQGSRTFAPPEGSIWGRSGGQGTTHAAPALPLPGSGRDHGGASSSGGGRAGGWGGFGWGNSRKEEEPEKKRAKKSKDDKKARKG